MATQPVGQVAYETRYETTPALAVGADDRRTWLMNHAGWGAIIAGIVTALLVQLLLSLLGLGVGLASFQITGNTASNPTVGGLSMSAAIWWVVSGIIASFVGGIVAGRLSGSARHSTAAWHGFVAWCATTLIVVWLLGTAVGGVLGGTFSAVGSTLSGLGNAAGAGVSKAAQATNPDSLEAEVRSLVNPNDAQTVQNSITAYVRASVNGDKAAADAARQKAVDSLARLANISPEEAQNRLNQLQQQYQRTAQQAKQTAEAARKDAARGALFAFAALLLGGIAGIVGGGLGTPRRAVPTTA